MNSKNKVACLYLLLLLLEIDFLTLQAKVPAKTNAKWVVPKLTVRQSKVIVVLDSVFCFSIEWYYDTIFINKGTDSTAFSRLFYIKI